MEATVLGMPVLTIAQMAVAAQLSILFVQSGLDKVFDYRGNKSYLTGHFKGSLLDGQVPYMLPVITALEVAAGFVSLAGLFFLFQGNSRVALYGSLLAMAAFLSLFFGQRVAKDYGGAATLVPYMTFNLIGMALLALE
ncbi:MAG: DoxX family protein [Saprospiraceae bacterium]|nr:DoxX family protein [Saprospiraceae bacterium]